MNKIICDICGTSYPESSEACPICGFSNNGSEDFLGEDVSYDEYLEETEEKADSSSGLGRKKEIFDFDEVNTEEEPEEEDDDEDYDEEEEEEAPRHNTFVVILLTMLIVALLGAAAFIFFRYFLPNMEKEEPVAPTEAVVETETMAAVTTEPTIPCQQMAMTNAGVAELSAEGQQFLLHIKALPENTTDRIIYTSADESIATVTEDGKITAVSEGETVIYISCGKTSMECPVIVKYVEETVPPTTEAAVNETEGVEAPEDENDATEAAVQETEGTETEEESDTKSAPAAGLKDVKLKLKKKDIQLGVYYSFQLVLDCDLTPEEVTWSSEHPHIAKVDEQGNVTAVKSGTTSITAKYGDQEVQCMVRCIWY